MDERWGWAINLGEGRIDHMENLLTWRSSEEALTVTARVVRAGAAPLRNERVVARGTETRETGVTRRATIAQLFVQGTRVLIFFVFSLVQARRVPTFRPRLASYDRRH